MKNIFRMTKNNIFLVINNKSTVIGRDHQCFDKISELLLEKEIDWDRIQELLSLKKALLNYIGNRLKVIDNVFYFTNKYNKTITFEESNPLVKKILDGFRDNDDYMPYLKFLDNLTQNPLMMAIKELYLFLSKAGNDFEITEDGCFLAYKKVRSDFKDIFTGTFDNSVGQVVKMKRQDVEFDREKVCSYGLHFCSKSYLDYYSSYGNNDVVVIVKVNPKDVVSIPSDYENAKGRCCRYEVVNVLKQASQELKDFNKKKKDRKVKSIKKDAAVKAFNKQAKIKLDKNLPIFHTVEEMRKLFKPRVVNAKCYVYNLKKNEYRLYQFIDGTSNANLKCIQSGLALPD